MENKDILIEKFINKQLTDTEKVAFETLLQEDEDFAQSVALDIALRERGNRERQAIESAYLKTRYKYLVTRRRVRYAVGAAATLLLFVGVSWFFFQSRQGKSEQIIANTVDSVIDTNGQISRYTFDSSSKKGTPSVLKDSLNLKKTKKAPVIVDIKGDGDSDMLIGKENSNILYLENIGANTNPLLEKETQTWSKDLYASFSNKVKQDLTTASANEEKYKDDLLKGQANEALSKLKQIISTNKDNLEINYYLGALTLFLTPKKTDEAIYYLEKVYENNYKQKTTAQYLILAYLNIGKIDLAKKIRQENLSIDADLPAFIVKVLKN